MANKVLHITNGDSLTNYLRDFGFNDEILTWQEMLCEGPTIPKINCEEFFKIRASFLKEYYNIEYDFEALNSELSKLDDIENFDEINLWFEYDLFCHINLLGVLNLLHQKEIQLPIYHICSGRVEGEKNLKGLSELSPEQLENHYQNKIRITDSDKELAIALWRTYCGKDHNIFKPYIITKSSFKYLSNCLKAHLKRFPDQQSGLSAIEYNILNLVKTNNIKSINHLLGYSLNYQGYYGYGDIQLQRIINHLNIFFEENENQIILNRKGHEAILSSYNYATEIKNDMVYGGINRLDYQFSVDENKLIKTVSHAD